MGRLPAAGPGSRLSAPGGVPPDWADHEDGFSVYNAGNTVAIVDQSQPSSAEAYTFSLGASTSNLWFEGSNGLPAELNLHVNVNGLPEPASLVVTGAAIAALAAACRRGC